MRFLQVAVVLLTLVVGIEGAGYASEPLPKLYRVRTQNFVNYAEFRAAVVSANAALTPFNPVGKPGQFTAWPAEEQQLLGLMASSKAYSLRAGSPDTSGEASCLPSRELRYFKITELRNVDPGQKNTYSFQALLVETLGLTESGDCSVKRTKFIQFFMDR
jgi:hypothetical protein